MNNDDFIHLLDEANAGRVSREVFDLASAELQNPNRKADPVILFGIIEYDRERSHKAVVEPFLAGPDARVASNALSLLCLIFPLTTDYIPEIVSFMRGVPWDDKERLRRTAIFAAGAHLQFVRNQELLEELIHVAAQFADTSDRYYVHTTIVEMLYAVVTGKNYLRTSDRPHDELISKEFFEDLLQKAKIRLAAGQG